MKKALLGVWASTLLWGQAEFYPTLKLKDAVETVNRYFGESAAAAQGRKHHFSVHGDDTNGKFEYTWMEGGKKHRRVWYRKDMVRGKLECQVSGETLPLVFRYSISLDPALEGNFVAWKIGSMNRDPQRFSTPGNKLIREIRQGFDLAIHPGFVRNPGRLGPGHDALFGGSMAREVKQPFQNPLFSWEYRSWCLPRVVPCSLSGNRPWIDSNFGEGDPAFLYAWWELLGKVKKMGFQEEYRLTLGPGLDAEKASAAEILGELIRNVMVAKEDGWVPWAGGGDALLNFLREAEAAIANRQKKDLIKNLEKAMEQLEPMKGKGRNEFYPMVRTYLIILKLKASIGP